MMSSTGIKQKYINFPKHGYFSPMLSPIDMIELGVYLGVPCNIPEIWKIQYPALQRFPDDKLHSPLADSSFNYFGIRANHEDFMAGDFWYWYVEFYFKAHLEDPSPERSYIMIARWYKRLFNIWDNIPRNTVTRSYDIDPATKQALIEMAWNPDYEPNFTKEWIIQMFPGTL